MLYASDVYTIVEDAVVVEFAAADSAADYCTSDASNWTVSFRPISDGDDRRCDDDNSDDVTEL